MRILLVEDEKKLAGIIARGLRAEGFSVDTSAQGMQGLLLAMSHDYDIIILDIMLARMTGTQILKKIRQKNKHVPILVLTSQDAVAHKMKHAAVRADDYLTKPFTFSELLVRIRALLRRVPVPSNDVLTVNGLEVDRLARLVRRAGRHVELSAREYALLEYMVLNAGRVLSRKMIIEHVWGQSFEVVTNIVDVYIRQLRAKIDEGHAIKLIKTVRSVGYVLNDEGI